MKKYLSLFSLLFCGVLSLQATNDVVCLKFNRTGANASSVTIDMTSAEGNVIDGASATLTSSHSLKETSNALTAAIVCPNVNGNTSPTITLTFLMSGLPEGFSFNNIGFDIHAFNGGSNYQERADGVKREWNVAVASNGTDFGTLTDIDIAAGVNTNGQTHQVWNISSPTTVTSNGALTVTLTITKGTENKGCFFGLSEMTLSTSEAVTPEPEPTPDASGKVYYIQWKNTGTSHITEGKDTYLTVSGKNTGKAQFWEFIPTDKADCYYIKNVVTGRYLGSCNKTPSSASRITTSTTPVEYYVGATSATTGEIAGCHYLSSTDCADYNNESAGPRALNKDGASDYIITWQAGTSRVGSYWKLVETTDTFVKPQHTVLAKSLNIYFNPCGVAGGNFITSAKVHGEGALDHIVYESANKPSSWHVPYPHDHGKVIRGATFDISITLKNTPSADLKANAYFDWDANGEFEATIPIILSGTVGTASISVPQTASNSPMRMRIRINSNGLDHAEDDVEGFVYDFHLTTAESQEERTVNVSVNDNQRGTATLSNQKESHPYGTTLTAKATPKGNATFICWREEGVVVSTDAEYTFTMNRNVNLKAYFTANTMPGTRVEALEDYQGEKICISIENNNIVATTNSKVQSLSLYTIDAAMVAQCCGNTMCIAHIAQDTYVLRVTTTNGYKNFKLYLNK